MTTRFKSREEKWQWLLDVAYAHDKSPNQLYLDIAVQGTDEHELREWFDIYNADHRPMPKGLLWGGVPISELVKNNLSS